MNNDNRAGAPVGALPLYAQYRISKNRPHPRSPKLSRTVLEANDSAIGCGMGSLSAFSISDSTQHKTTSASPCNPQAYSPSVGQFSRDYSGINPTLTPSNDSSVNLTLGSSNGSTINPTFSPSDTLSINPTLPLSNGSTSGATAGNHVHAPTGHPSIVHFHGGDAAHGTIAPDSTLRYDQDLGTHGGFQPLKGERGIYHHDHNDDLSIDADDDGELGDNANVGGPFNITALEMVKRLYPNRKIKSTTGNFDNLYDLPAVRIPELRENREVPNLTRASYIEGLLAQISGTLSTMPCGHCRAGQGAWTLCVVVDGCFKGACACCWFGGTGNRCQYHEKHRRQQPGPLAQAPMPSNTLDIAVEDTSRGLQQDKQQPVQFAHLPMDLKRNGTPMEGTSHVLQQRQQQQQVPPVQVPMASERAGFDPEGSLPGSQQLTSGLSLEGINHPFNQQEQQQDQQQTCAPLALPPMLPATQPAVLDRDLLFAFTTSNPVLRGVVDSYIAKLRDLHADEFKIHRFQYQIKSLAMELSQIDTEHARYRNEGA